jgi:hypothetical protein
MLLSLATYAKPKLVLTDHLSKAYKEYTSLRMTNGRSYLLLSKLNDPENILYHYIENYEDFFTIFIKEEKQIYDEKVKLKDARIQAIHNTDENNPYRLYAEAEILLQWAVLKLKFDDKVSAASDVYKAYNLLEENKAKFPTFNENAKSLSIIYAMAENLPQWIRSIVGIKASVSIGTRDIKRLADLSIQNKSMYKDEVVAIYSYILFYANNKKEEAYQVLNDYQLDHRSNPLITFLKASMAQKTGRNDIAIKILEERPKGEYLPFYYLDFMYGKSKLYKQDKNADQYILKFIQNFKGRHYIREAYQKLAWYYLSILGDKEKYRSTIKQCLSLGQNSIDEDIQATKEAKENTVPDKSLLSARLLFDGGYLTQSQKILNADKDRLSKSNNKDEYHYRLARVADALHNSTQAIYHYNEASKLYKPDRYYGCSAALYLGYLYEKNGNKAKAIEMFNLCTSRQAGGYTASLHQKAKTALSRLR